jgi:hypothetical protein
MATLSQFLRIRLMSKIQLELVTRLPQDLLHRG